jgi:hypothetical protein
VEPTRITAAAGSFVAAGLLVGMLFEGWLTNRWAALAAIVGLAVALDVVLSAYAGGLTWARAEPEDWVAHATLNAIGVAVILHVGVGRRWPLPRLDGAPA